MEIVAALRTSYSVYSFIVATIQQVQSSKNQLQVLATATKQLLSTLNTEFTESRLVATRCARPLVDLETLLRQVHRFVEEEKERAFLRLLLQKDSRIAKIELFHRRLGMCVNAFQISSLINIRTMQADSKRAQARDTEALHAHLISLEKDNARLLQTLEINQNNTIAMMVSIQKQLNTHSVDQAEQKFYSHTLQYLTSRSGQNVMVEEWMISSFEIEYGPEIGAGGFGTVYHGTWNRTEVAIKNLQNAAGAKPSAASLRNEIKIWSTLRHPNILQFLGANTLDDKPFIVMPYVPHNAREFLRERPTLDPVPILRDISLGLEYLHSRKICHGDLKAINVLVESTGRALLCDFGLARLKADADSRTLTTMDVTPVLGSRNWMAPELLTGGRYRMPADIYAFGMTVYELYTDENPLLSIPYGEFIDLVVHRGVRPERPEADEGREMSDELWEVATRCWASNTSDRPTATQVHDELASMISKPHIAPPDVPGAHLGVLNPMKNRSDSGVIDPQAINQSTHNFNPPTNAVRSSPGPMVGIAAASGPQFDADCMSELLGMGFPVIHCQKALLATGNSTVHDALDWLFAHMDNADINDPIVPQADASGGDGAQTTMLSDMGFTPPQARKVLRETAASAPQFDAVTMSELLGMGFPAIQCQKALLATGNSTAHAAMEWLLAHMDDTDIDDPIVPQAGASGGDGAQTTMLSDMGFTPPQARKALRETFGNTVHTVEWLFNRPDDNGTDDMPAPSAAVGGPSVGPGELSSPRASSSQRTSLTMKPKHGVMVQLDDPMDVSRPLSIERPCPAFAWQHRSPFPRVSEVLQMAEQLQIAALDGLIAWKDLNFDPSGVAALRNQQAHLCSSEGMWYYPDNLRANFNLLVTEFRCGEFFTQPGINIDNGFNHQMDIRKKVFGIDAPETLNTMFLFAAAYRALGRLDQALNIGLEVVEQRTTLHGSHDLQMYTAVQGVALTHHYMNNNRQAMARQLQVFTGRHKILGIKHRDTVMAMRTLAVFRAVWAHENLGGNLLETLKDTFNRQVRELEEGAMSGAI
ncbi:hypothetical protein C8F04DRAFT_1050769 [Mycena alexandri]|uniref:Uncharacterized protein n=1 Tax=Mycena alexandri TaxID=1745969 RepID=A0AAD6S5Z6_9AGAR|nr:hypothetical protein C8F04DRAFT_1050769 [Mycena alexandri]